MFLSIRVEMRMQKSVTLKVLKKRKYIRAAVVGGKNVGNVLN